jgi:hypothetical protein
LQAGGHRFDPGPLHSANPLLNLDPLYPLAWQALPALPAGTPISVGLADAGSAVLVVMSDGHAYRLLNQSLSMSSVALTWIALPPIPGTAAAA